MPAKFTISFIYQYYESDKTPFDFLLNDILNCPDHNNIKFFIHKYEVKNKLIKNIKFEQQNNEVIQVTQKEYNVPDYHYDLLLAQKKWGEFLEKFAGKENAEYNILFTIQHSNGYGIKNKDTAYLHDAQVFKDQIKRIKEIINRYTSLQPLVPPVAEGNNYRVIPYFVLADAIKNAFGSNKIDLLFLNNCFSQTFETGLIFNDCVEFLGSSECTIPGFGVNFKALFTILSNSSESSPVDTIKIAANLVSSFTDKFSEPRILTYLRTLKENQNKPDIELIKMGGLHCFNINKLTDYPKIHEKLKEIVTTNDPDILIPIMQKVREEKNSCRDISLDVNNELGLIDMCNFFKEVEKEAKGTVKFPADFISLLTSVVTAYYFPPVFSGLREPNEEFKIMPHGAAFFFPASRKYNGDRNNRLYSTGQLIFALLQEIDYFRLKDSPWVSFLNKYH